MKHVYFAIIALLTLTPQLTFAQGTIQKLLVNIPTFFNNILIPFFFGIAFLFFVINVVRYFVIGGSSEEGRDKAKNLIIYSIAAFVFIIIFWGIVNLLTTSLGLQGKDQPCPDFIQKFQPTKCP